MSGDQVQRKSLLIAKLPAAEVKESENDEMEAVRAPPITVTANGHEIQSCLNPNALEFVPSYLQNMPQIDLNEKTFEQIVRQKSINNENEFINKILETNLTKIEDRIDISDVFQDLKYLAVEEENVNFKDKLEIDKIENQVHVLFANASGVVSSSSETIKSVISAREKETASTLEAIKKENIDQKFQHNVENIQLNVRYTSSSAAVATTSSETAKSALSEIENDSLSTQKNQPSDCKSNCNLNINDPKAAQLESLQVDNFNESNMPNPEKTDQDCEKQLIVAKEMKEIENESIIEINSTGDQQNISKEINENKKKLTINSKIARVPKPTATGAIKKVSLPKPPEKEIKPKSEPTIAQVTNVSKISKNASLIHSKTTSKLLKKDVTKVFNKDTISNISTTSTEKSLLANKSYPNNNSVKFSEKPIILGQNTKESNPKSPRATVSSKLRKTETQKRQNLFVEIDAIKMSELLFK